jgi:hypothetical protein
VEKVSWKDRSGLESFPAFKIISSYCLFSSFRMVDLGKEFYCLGGNWLDLGAGLKLDSVTYRESLEEYASRQSYSFITVELTSASAAIGVSIPTPLSVPT